jgi:hypothetical protein
MFFLPLDCRESLVVTPGFFDVDCSIESMLLLYRAHHVSVVSRRAWNCFDDRLAPFPLLPVEAIAALCVSDCPIVDQTHRRLQQDFPRDPVLA